MHEIAQLLLLVAAFYATFGIMSVGFGMMLAGPDGASAAGNLFFVWPAEAVFVWSRSVVVAFMVTVCTLVVGTTRRWIASEIKEIGRDIRWLVSRERGWVWRR